MNVKELKEKLEKLHPETVVMVQVCEPYDKDASLIYGVAEFVLKNNDSDNHYRDNVIIASDIDNGYEKDDPYYEGTEGYIEI